VLAKTDMKEIHELPMIMLVARIKTSAMMLRLVRLLRTLTVLTLSVDLLANVMTDTKKSMESARILMSALTKPTSAMMSTRTDVTIPKEVMTVSVRPDFTSTKISKTVLISLNVLWLKFLAMLTLTALTLTTKKTEKLTPVSAEQDTPETDLLVKITTSVLLSSGMELITSTSKPESAEMELARILPVGTNVLVTADMKVQLANTQLALM